MLHCPGMEAAAKARGKYILLGIVHSPGVYLMENVGYFWACNMRAWTSDFPTGISLFYSSDSYHHECMCFSMKLARILTSAQRYLSVKWIKIGIFLNAEKIVKKHEQLTVLSINQVNRLSSLCFPWAVTYSFGSNLVLLPEYLFAMIYQVIKLSVSHKWINNYASWAL